MEQFYDRKAGKTEKQSNIWRSFMTVKAEKMEKQSNVWRSFMTAKLEKWKSSQMYSAVL